MYAGCGMSVWNDLTALYVGSVEAVDREPLVDIDNTFVIEVVQQDLLIAHALLIRVFVPDAELYGHASRHCRSLRGGDVAGSGFVPVTARVRILRFSTLFSP
jgi:hypothetical protein